MAEASVEHGPSLLQDFAIIMVVAGIVSVVFRRLDQPVVLGYLVAGYIVGPHSPPFAFVQNVEAVREFADFGIVLLMFGLGLEFSFDRLRRVGVVAAMAAAVEIGVMIALGFSLGRAFGWSPLEATFLGAALSISSTAIIVKVLQETGRMNAESSRVMFGILVVEDFFAVIMMTVLAGIGSTGRVELADAGWLLLRLVVFTLVTLALGLRLFSRFVDLVAKLGSKEVLTVLTIGSAFALALFADALGLSLAAGAFIIGAITAESRSAQEVRHLSEPIRDVFGALFFVAMGMLIDLGALRQYVAPVAIIVLVVIFGKVVACYIGVFLSGYSKRTAFQVGMGMAQVGEFSLVISKIGHENGAAGAFIQPLMAVVTGVTSLTTPYLIKSSDRVGTALATRVPGFFHRRSDDVEFWAKRVRGLIGEESEAAHKARQGLTVVVLNLLILALLLIGARLVIGFVHDEALPRTAPGQRLALIIGVGAMVLATAPVLAIWRGLRGFLQATVQRAGQQEGAPSALRQRHIVNTLPVVTATGITIVIVLEALPLFLRLLAIGDPVHFIPFLLIGMAIAWAAWDSLDQVHKRVEGFLTLRDTPIGMRSPNDSRPANEPGPEH